MSSILDALNKLEQEKAQAARENEENELDPAITAHDLVGRSMLRDRVTLRVTPAALMLSVGALAVTLAVVVIAAAMIFSRASAKPAEQTAAAQVPMVQAPAPSPAPAVIETTPPVEPPAAAADAPAVATAAPDIPATSDAPPASTEPAAQPLPSPQPTSFVPPAQPAVVPQTAAPSPTVIARQPEPKAEAPAMLEPEVIPPPKESPSEPVAAAPKPAVSEPAPRTRVAAAPPLVDEDDLPPRRTPPAPKATAPAQQDVALDRLPLFTPVDQMRYGFERLTINMMKPADATTPQGSAILSFTETSPDGSKLSNRMRFFEGQRIQQSPLRMFKVEDGRVGIEDVRTGDRYQLKF